MRTDQSKKRISSRCGTTTLRVILQLRLTRLTGIETGGVFSVAVAERLSGRRQQQHTEKMLERGFAPQDYGGTEVLILS